MFINALEQARHHVRSLWIAVGLSFAVNIVLILGWIAKDNQLTVILPPQIPQSGLTIQKNTVPPASVYAFAFYVWQRLNHWGSNGQKDYRQQIETLSPFLTPRFRLVQVQTYNRLLEGGELQGRIRLMTGSDAYTNNENKPAITINAVSIDKKNNPKDFLGIPTVQNLGHGAWQVTLTMNLTEMMASNAQVIKDTTVIYRLRVVRLDADAEQNPWGLALDGLINAPQRIETR